MMMFVAYVTDPERVFLALLRDRGPLSRGEIHRALNRRPNTVGDAVAQMIDKRLIREGTPQSSGIGRPSTPLEIDPEGRSVMGLALREGYVGLCRLNLLGQPLEAVLDRQVGSHESLLDIAQTALTEQLTANDIAIGLSSPGFVDPQARTILQSSATPATPSISLDPIYAAAGHRPVVLENDMHALAAHWTLTHALNQDEDLLLVNMADGAIGAALLVAGKPNRGCVVGGNELGHVRLPVETDVCFCGHTGCLERICSSAQWTRLDGRPGDLSQQARALDPQDAALRTVIDQLGLGLANAINFIRPNRLVLAGPLAQIDGFTQTLICVVRGHLLGPLVSRVAIETWGNPPGSIAQVAGWLALASLYSPNWIASKST